MGRRVTEGRRGERTGRRGGRRRRSTDTQAEEAIL
jgi:hypothetical protein